MAHKAKSKGRRPTKRRERTTVFRFAVLLWSGVALAAIILPWPYAMSAILFATFLHFACIDGDTETRQYARRKTWR